jgi:sugar lactone lactonase YvrE
LGDPDGLELDPSGNLFIADWLNNRVRQVDTNGIIRTVAGSGAGGYAGENVPATDASLWSPYGVAVDVFGNIFIADEDNNRVRKVDTDGIITTVAGNGSNGYSGDGGQATNASVSPVDVAVDASGNIFIAEQFNNVIRKVQTNGIISTVAGDGTEGYSGDGKAATNASLSGPTGVAVDVFGNIFIADEGNSRIRKVGVNGIITTVAGNGSDTYSGNDGPATQAGVGYPNGVAVDASSNLFIAQSTHIRKVDAAGIITTVAGNGTSGYAGDGGPATEASLSNPANLTVDSSGNILFADTYTNRIRKVDINGIISTIAGSGSPGYSGDGGPATNASLAFPSAVAADPSGNILIAAGGGDYQVIITGPQGSVTSTVATVTVALPPLQAALNPALTALLTFSGAPGSLYVLQAASNLDTPINWQPIFTNVADSNGGWTFTDTNILGYPAIFYRITLP